MKSFFSADVHVEMGEKLTRYDKHLLSSKGQCMAPSSWDTPKMSV